MVELNGSVRSVEVYRVVNVGSDPELKPRVLADGNVQVGEVVIAA